ncbi:hypothetical protein [Thermococcus sp.]|uniref:hypothetical protein n=1 Tax=Thermococcus sp. TaxID=35749 RepID=UPI00262623E0|nr:hypothetical protein [Thermococcus sp.]MCD6144134.1 hypothetical protein [Thermococcus sp.]
MKHTLFVFFSLFCILMGAALVFSVPPWLQEEIYVKYIAYSSTEGGAFVGFSNGTLWVGSNYAEFSWKVLDVKNNIAYVKLYLFVPSAKKVWYQKIPPNDGKVKLEELKRKYGGLVPIGSFGSCNIYKEGDAEITICENSVSIVSDSRNYTIGVFDDSAIEQESVATIINRSAVVQIDLIKNIMTYNNRTLGRNLLFIYPGEILPNSTIMEIENATLKVQSFNSSRMTFYTYYGKFNPPIGVLWTTHIRTSSVGGRDILFYDYSTGLLLAGLMLFAPHWKALGFDGAMLRDDEFQRGKTTFTEEQTYGFGMVLAETNAELYVHSSLQDTSPSSVYLLVTFISIIALVIMLVRGRK